MAITQQASKLRPNELYGGGASGVATSFYKFEYDGPFDQVQHLVASKVATGTPGTFKVQFAVTDEIAVDTKDKAWLPRRAGVTYNDKSANGWKDATFDGGALTKTIGLAPSQGNNSTIHMPTDVMNLSSIPRADGKPGSILLVKVTQTDAAAAYTTATGSGNSWDGARGTKPWFREWRSTRINSDGISNLSLLPTDGYNGGYEFPGFSIVTNNSATVPSDILLFTGDSRKSAAYMTFVYANPARMAAASLGSPAHPITTVNGAGSGHSQTQFLALAMDMINAGLRPTVVHVPAFSQNGFSNFATFKANLDGFMASVRATPGLANVKFVLDTDYFVGGYGGTQKETDRQQCITYAKSLANGTTVFCLDSDAIITDYTNPALPTGKAAYFSGTSFIGGDGVHAGPLGLDAMAYGDGTVEGLQSIYSTAFAVSEPAPVIISVMKDLSASYSIDAPAPSYVRSDLQAIYSIGNTVVTVAANRVAKFTGRKRVVKFESTDPAYRGGKWYVAKGINDELFYAGDISKQLADSGTTAVSVTALAVGVTAITPPTLQGSVVVVKVGGFNIASDNYVTFRVVCANGERFDRTIIFERANDDVVYKKDPDDQLFYAADVSEMLTSGVTTAVSFETIVAGVTKLSSLSVQGVVMPALIGGFDIATGVSNYATFRVTCANGERFDKTIRFEREET